MEELFAMTPKEIVSYLDEYIIGQKEAKKVVAIALRNRYRRLQLPKEIQDEVVPKNILMIGSTGVGKTEIARRMAKIMGLPFVKVEASKYTEVGFVGRDVESMVRDLVVASINLVKEEYRTKSVKDIEKYVADKIIEKLIPPLPKGASEQKIEEYENASAKMRAKLQNGEIDHLKIEIEIPKRAFEIEDGNMPAEFAKVQETIAKVFIATPKDNPKKEVSVKEAKELLKAEASEALLDMDAIKHEGVKRAESSGIIFIDEIDKVAVSGNGQSRQDPSKEGVQRDLLPIVEGSVVNTKYGSVKTDHILFIAAGAFSLSKPSDLIPELQGRFPIRVELNALTKDDFVKILKDPQNSLLKQYVALMKADGIKLVFTQEAVDKIAEIAFSVNQGTDNIGARRLSTILEKLLEDVLYEGPDMEMGEITITEAYVEDKLGDIITNKDLTKFIL